MVKDPLGEWDRVYTFCALFVDLGLALSLPGQKWEKILIDLPPRKKSNSQGARKRNVISYVVLMAISNIIFRDIKRKKIPTTVYLRKKISAPPQ